MLIWSRKNSWTTDVFEDFVQGKETAFKYFHSLYYRHLLLTTCASIGDMVEAEDVVTDAFVIVYKKRASIKSPEHLDAYLSVVARNLCISRYKNRQRVREVELALGRRTDYSWSDTSLIELLEYEQWHGKMLDRIRLASERLPPRKKIVFQLYFYEQYDRRGIAAKLRLKEQSVRNLLNRAIDSIRRCV